MGEHPAGPGQAPERPGELAEEVAGDGGVGAVDLGPLVGRLAAAEILDGVSVELLAPYRLERFAAPTAGR